MPECSSAMLQKIMEINALDDLRINNPEKYAEAVKQMAEKPLSQVFQDIVKDAGTTAGHKTD